MLRRPTITLFALLLTASIALAADAVPLPYSQPLDRDEVAIRLREGRLDVVVDDVASPQLVIDDYDNGRSTEGFALIERGDDWLLVEQPLGDENGAPRLSVRLVLSSRHELTVQGSGMDVMIAHAGTERVRPAQAPVEPTELTETPTPAAWSGRYRLELDDSNVTVAGLSGLFLRGDATQFELEETSGTIEAQLFGGSLALTSHTGGLLARGDGSRIDLQDLQGTARITLDRGNLWLSGGAGSADVHLRSSDAVFQGWPGSLRVQGNDNRLEIQQSGVDGALYELRGEDLDVTLGNVGAKLSVELVAGRFVGGGIDGAMTLRAREGTDIEMSDVRGRLDLRLADGARARLGGIEGDFTGSVTDGSIEVDGARQFELTAVRADVVAREIGAPKNVQVTDTDLELEVARPTGSFPLALSGTSFARISLPEPCLVDLGEAGEDAAEEVEASGCEMVGGGRPQPRTARRRQGRVSRLQVDLQPGATLVVSGGP
jgi:hypothetical protein